MALVAKCCPATCSSSRADNLSIGSAARGHAACCDPRVRCAASCIRRARRSHTFARRVPILAPCSCVECTGMGETCVRGFHVEQKAAIPKETNPARTTIQRCQCLPRIGLDIAIASFPSSTHLVQISRYRCRLYPACGCTLASAARQLEFKMVPVENVANKARVKGSESGRSVIHFRSSQCGAACGGSSLWRAWDGR